MPRESGTRDQPHRLHHRQPEREERRKRGPSVDPHGFDASKLIKGKKRHILVDMQGLLLHAIVHSAGVQDRDGGIWLLTTFFGQFPFLAKLFVDSAYAGSIFHTALTKVLPNLGTEIVKRSDRAKGFVPLPKRWTVERTIAWLNRCRRLAEDSENLNRNALVQSLIKSPDGLLATSPARRRHRSVTPIQLPQLFSVDRLDGPVRRYVAHARA
jgi:transposase